MNRSQSGRLASPEAAAGGGRRRARRPAELPFSDGDLAALRARLLDHYDRSRRPLPWREDTDPYRVLVSETMLQQTRVETVKRYWSRWLERFPDLAALAAAEEAEVLKAWEGLGYYRRAQNLHRAARVARELPGAGLPSSYAGLRQLPGVGEYTAGAVASIAFGERVPAIDGNVRRVLSRLFDVERPRASWLWATASALVDAERPGDWNQALMDLGAILCRPRAPHCHACPLERWCRARAAGTEEARRAGPRRKPPRRTTFVLAVLRRGTCVLLERRPPGGLLGGLWAFPEAEIPPHLDELEVQRAADRIAHATAVRLGTRPLGAASKMASLEHRFTHLHARYVPFVVDVEATGREWALTPRDENPHGDADAANGRGPAHRPSSCDGFAWVEPGAPTVLAVPVAQRRLLDRLASGPQPRGRSRAQGKGTIRSG
jgi:A/G-specific adenine glycosylase